MKKRRILVIKSILPLFIFCLVSAFFYAPIDVLASSSISTSVTSSEAFSGGSYHVSASSGNGTFDLSGSISNVLGSALDSNLYYKVSLSGNWSLSTNKTVYYRDIIYQIYSDEFIHSLVFIHKLDDRTHNDASGTFNTSVVFKGSDFSFLSFKGSVVGYGGSTGNLTATFNINISVDSVVELVSADSDLYQSGYQAGYDKGYAQGNANGYDSGYSNGYSAGNLDGYDSGFTAGVDSVDTSAIRKDGFDSGYSVGYSKGYNSGFTEGYNSAMSRIESWGADTANYPILLGSGSIDNGHIYGALIVKNDSLFFDDSADVGSFYDSNGSSVSIDPTHTYKVVIKSFDYTYNMSMSVSAQYYLCVGNQSYHISEDSGNTPAINNYFYVPGNVMSKNFFVRAVGTLSNLSSSSPVGAEILINISFDVYDFGPSGNLQNQIANQTDNLTNGYNGTSGDSAASSFSDGVAEYDTAENSIFTSASSKLDEFQFFDFKSVPAMITGISFVTSIMTSIFNSMGGLSGAGIVLSVLFSVMLVTMIIGLARRYQSNGKIERIRSYQRDTNSKINALYNDSKKNRGD